MSTSTSAVTATYSVTGMTCGHCARSVTAGVGAIPGVAAVEVDLAGGTVTVTGEAAADRAAVTAAVASAGYAVVPAPDAEPPAASCCGSCH
jgi:copper chaperone CopZ